MPTENVMWNGTCKYQSFADQLRTTRLSGCDVLTIGPMEFKQMVAQGSSAREVRQMAADEGVRVTHLDPLCTWAPEWRPADVTEDWYPFFDTSVDEFLSIAEELEIQSLSAVCSFPPGLVSVEELFEPFAELCRRAEGLRVDLEFVPNWGLLDLESAWRIVEEVDAPNAGVMFDFRHFFRHRPDFELLQAIPTEKIHAVQLCDGTLERIPGHTELQDILDDRLPLGEGEFDIDRLLRLLADKGALTRVGPEYHSDRMQGLTPEQIAQVMDDTYWPRVEPLGVRRSS